MEKIFKQLPNPLLENIYSFCFDKDDLYVKLCLSDRIDKNRFDDIHKHLKLIELKKLKVEGTLDEKINGYDFWTLGLYFFSKESVHNYNTFHFNIYEGDIYFKSNSYILGERLKEIYKMITGKTCKEEGFTKDKIMKKVKQNKYIFVKFDIYIAFNIRKLLDNMPIDIFEFMREYMCLKCIEEERENLFEYFCKGHDSNQESSDNSY